MRHISLTSILAIPLLLLAASCGKGETPVSPLPEIKDGEGCELSVRVDCGIASTKAVAQSDANEQTIQNIQIWVFRAGDGADAGTLDITASYGFDTPLNETSGAFYGPDNDELRIKCTTGPRRIYAIVNDAEDRTRLPGVRTEYEFLQLATFLKDNRLNGLFMSGSVDKTLIQGRDKVTVVVDRMVAAIVLKSVKNDFYAEGYRDADSFRVCDCYLLNVPAKNTFRGNVEPSTLEASDWYARGSRETNTDRSALIYDSVTPKVVNYGESDNTVHTFYSYANRCTFSTAEEWSPRATILVVEAEILYGEEWVRYYYPVALTGTEDEPGISANTRYAVNLTIHRPGSTDPNKPVTFFDCTPEIVVSPWNDGEPYNPEI